MIQNASKFTSVMPAHKSIGKKNYNAIEKNDQKYDPLMRHFEYIKNLGEVQATQVVAALVDGMQGHANGDDSLDVTYLPILLGYQSCYKGYMALLGNIVRTTAMGAFIVMGEDSKEVDAGEYCSFQLSLICGSMTSRTSRRVGRWRWRTSVRIAMHLQTATGILQNHTMGRDNDDGNGNGNDNGKGKCSNDGYSNDGDNNYGRNAISNVGFCPIRNIDITRLEAASTKADKERELMLLQAAAHIKMARAQMPSTRPRWRMRLQMQLQGKKTW